MTTDPQTTHEILGYWDGPYWVFTEAHHLRRGSCCGNRCRHCPYEPKALKGCSMVRRDVIEGTQA